jgi:TRAP transporter TAXI family solute receptor
MQPPSCASSSCTRPVSMDRSLAATRRTVLIGALAAAPASAETPGNASFRANAGVVGVISGGVDGTYVRIAADLAAVLDDGDRLRVLPILGKGSVQNLNDLVYLRGVDLGIVQSDAFAYVLAQDLLPGAARAVQYLTKLYNEEVHILARADVERIDQLAGQKVNVDVPGSGTAMTGSLIFSGLKIPIQVTNEVQDVALQRLRAGATAAMLYVAGKPARLFSNIGPDSGLHFLPIPPAADLLQTYLPAQLDHATYPSLVGDGAPVETLAVGSVLATFGWQPGTERYRKVARFAEAFRARFEQFQHPPRHPKWREVSLDAQVPGWTRFPLVPATEPARPRDVRRRSGGRTWLPE